MGRAGADRDSVAAMAVISPIEAVTKSVERTKEVLFRPFSLEKWLGMGFVSFLATCGEGGGSNFQMPDLGGGSGRSGRSGGPGEAEFERLAKNVLQFVTENLTLIIAVTAVAVVTFFALGLLLSWLTCRAKFVALDNIVKNQAALKEPWGRLAPQGNSLFYFRFLTSLVSLGALVIAGVVAFGVFSLTTGPGAVPTAAIIALTSGVGLFTLMVLPVIIANMLVTSFGVPWMYAHGGTAFQAFGKVWRSLVLERFLSLLLFLLLSTVLAIGAAIIGLLAIVLTCCIGALPYINSVLLLPIAVFFRCYTLYFLEELGPEWRLLDKRPERSEVFR